MKKVLIITYYWPPSGGGGVQRWLKFSKYLPEFGWEPIIFTPENPDFDMKDDTLLNDVNPELEVIKLPIWEPYKLFEKISGKQRPSQGLIQSSKKQGIFTKLAIWLRGNLLIPDPRKFWVKPSVKFLKDFVQDNGINTVITTGPPHSMHLIGLQLKRKLNIRWIADFRDPWSKWDMLENFKLSSLARRMHRKLELRVLQNADEVITVSQTWVNEFEDIHKRTYRVITNGFDDSDFDNIKPKKGSGKIVISHFGLINTFRNPVIFWDVLRRLSTQVQIEVRLYGTIEEPIKDSVMADPILSNLIEFKPPVSHDEVLRAYAESDILLLLLNNSNNAHGHIPGKLFEYLASQRPIIALGPKNGDAANIINQCEAGTTVSWKDEEALRKAILSVIDGEESKRELKAIEKFSRRNLTQELVQKVLAN
ncbi:glycosyltransferase family 4 protein [Fulvivirga lutea]|uniref:Glycosyltransferase family 4 protein n=1 Tax=Fulvivirga lutea TaxID=2810512 RepID=A0A974WG40_9BACT|nr:glycosyltransferase family 4 protein [Fulvivirga lutea]QSE97189.1 glycosyltransferase family 4 protein [Fulvivirga lutea]